jgi:predicted Ser/Thr protein kinase
MTPSQPFSTSEYYNLDTTCRILQLREEEIFELVDCQQIQTTEDDAGEIFFFTADILRLKESMLGNPTHLPKESQEQPSPSQLLAPLSEDDKNHPSPSQILVPLSEDDSSESAPELTPSEKTNSSFSLEVPTVKYTLDTVCRLLQLRPEEVIELVENQKIQACEEDTGELLFFQKEVEQFRQSLMGHPTLVSKVQIRANLPTAKIFPSSTNSSTSSTNSPTSSSSMPTDPPLPPSQRTIVQDFSGIQDALEKSRVASNSSSEGESEAFSRPTGGFRLPEMMGKVLDVCRIEKKLGEGGMGAVYLAHHLTLDKKVALKVLPQELTRNQKFVERFFREARAAAKLEHPNIVQVYDVREHELGHFIVMQYVEGTTLTKKTTLDQLTFEEKLSILLQVTQGLHFAHQRHLIHRDIKTENILISNKGEVKIADFGLAKASDDTTSQLTADGQILGTPDYMAPEICAGQKATAKSDIYALGIVFYNAPSRRTDPPKCFKL